MTVLKILIIQFLLFASFFIYNAAFFNLFNSKRSTVKTKETVSLMDGFDALESKTLRHKNGMQKNF
jgi:hypothetical protein